MMLSVVDIWGFGDGGPLEWGALLRRPTLLQSGGTDLKGGLVDIDF